MGTKTSRLLMNSQEKTNETRDVPRLGFTREQAAQVLGISLPSLDRLAARGLIRPSRALRRPIYSRQELEKFLRDTAS